MPTHVCWLSASSQALRAPHRPLFLRRCDCSQARWCLPHPSLLQPTSNSSDVPAYNLSRSELVLLLSPGEWAMTQCCSLGHLRLPGQHVHCLGGPCLLTGTLLPAAHQPAQPRGPPAAKCPHSTAVSASDSALCHLGGPCQPSSESAEKVRRLQRPRCAANWHPKPQICSTAGTRRVCNVPEPCSSPSPSGCPTPSAFGALRLAVQQHVGPHSSELQC